ncbi:hypothetical protein G8770_22915 [Aestuariicella hydrocarbonica]|uniref:Uncharacterized protein n=1 Tax=Pseudomaricurvus hydrocarbonicus TaxID=1470433 RepID=A0A9E5T2G8_9GAMM|nr:hypothetical protein [Aestuariicella hydrocarbonica]NHO68415.1 hypothetical protein [Aestuariicella hydrocarbonica]
MNELGRPKDDFINIRDLVLRIGILEGDYHVPCNESSNDEIFLKLSEILSFIAARRLSGFGLMDLDENFYLEALSLQNLPGITVDQLQYVETILAAEGLKTALKNNWAICASEATFRLMMGGWWAYMTEEELVAASKLKKRENELKPDVELGQKYRKQQSEFGKSQANASREKREPEWSEWIVFSEKLLERNPNLSFRRLAFLIKEKTGTRCSIETIRKRISKVSKK